MNKKRQTWLPILQSSLPPFKHMQPYLEQIEHNRCHSNFGKLFRQFEEKMGALFAQTEKEVALFCNGTMALVAGLLALDVPRNKCCLMPSWTFSATPASTLLLGIKPYFLDVDKNSQALTPDMVRTFLQQNIITKDEVGAVIPVSPFGAPINRQQWDEFTRETHIPVIIDAAASFDTVHQHPSMEPGETPMMISLHATKIFGIGEGGMLISSNQDFIARSKEISNFGFNIDRVSGIAGINAKMSEYQAAIGHAVLDAWWEIREKRQSVTENYCALFNHLGVKHWLAHRWLSNTCNILVPGYAPDLRDYLIAQNIESRIWWGNGCHQHPAYSHLSRMPSLPNTQALSQTMLGLPFSIDTSWDDIALIGDHIADFMVLQQSPQLLMENARVFG